MKRLVSTQGNPGSTTKTGNGGDSQLPEEVAMLPGPEEIHAIDLMQQWSNVYQEALALAEEIEQLPDECPCGDADSHLNGRCPCCGTHPHANVPHTHSLSCT